jgi:hypothetical protein
MRTREKAIFGRPDMDRCSTSHVERFNLELRMMVRRLTRLTLSYSKKLSNHRAMLALAIGFHNFCRYHQTLQSNALYGARNHEKHLEHRGFTDSNNLGRIIVAPDQPFGA